jgi:hypothetical protein
LGERECSLRGSREGGLLGRGSTSSQNIEILKFGVFGGAFSAFLSRVVLGDFGIVHF